ncbi:hypothetical protein DOM21_02270 [Bacteriovorax stolpii]|uniref:B12-binding domain-containing radical SAM protein n=1 Tax=Bacteriovorax stolpii TaxID=960 RepID=UPI0011587724|nr:radical SAM protein [Bacteriovorax stolpii]QDK40299.1 hypothetical protein DOM21_02270 [Bacteriovorax stolpii]
MDVVLFSDISPHQIWIRTIGVYRLASICRKAGLSTKVLYGLTDYPPEIQRQILERYVTKETKLVALSTTFMVARARYSGTSSLRNKYAQELLDLIKEKKEQFPHIPFVAGGGNSNDEIFSFFDHVALGYGDQLITKFATDIHSLKKFRRVVDGRNIYISDNTFNNDYSTEYHETDVIHRNETMTIEVSRGCKFKCKFCSFPLNGRKANEYIKPGAILEKEFIDNYERFGIQNYILADDTFNEDAEKLEYFLGIVENLPFKIQYTGYFRLDLLDKQRAYWKRLLDSGLRGAFFGIETLNDKSAQVIGKGFGRESTLKTLYDLRDIWGDEVNTAAGFIVGLPYDTKEEFQKWADIVRAPGFPVHCKSFEPLSINKKSDISPWQSEFQMDSEKWGYKLFEKREGKYYWESPDWNYAEAAVVAEKTVREIAEHGGQNFGSFKVQMLMGLGLSYKEAFSLIPGNKASIERINEVVSSRIKANLDRELALLERPAQVKS